MEPFHYGIAALALLALLSPGLRRLADRAGVAVDGAPATTLQGRIPFRTLHDCMGRGDNLLLLRLIAASIVIYAHSHAISPVPGDGDGLTALLGIYSGSVAVYVFFFISGFLVTGSWLRQGSLRSFLGARLLRLLPAYAACLVVCALLIGAAVSTRSVPDYFADPLTWRFIFWNLGFPEMMQFTLPGVFEQHRQQAINGSLWTLPAEVRAYALLAVFGLLGLLDRLPRLVMALVLVTFLVVAADYRIPMVFVAETQPMFGYFALGALAWNARRVIPLNAWVATGLIILAVVSFGSAAYPYAFAAALTYACLWFTYVPRSLLFFNRFGDYSYGVYLWGFPMQQLVVHWLHEPAPTLITLLAWPLALACAILSWHAIEKPALSLRRRPAAIGSGSEAGPSVA